ncbi:hypothetical protein K3495_g2572 [Podosphaera aphanis]|nr:hypothetical protein K3495_g2572 [Podosphaera aphanis]
MLSNPTSTLHDRQRQHRRQHSTPTAFEPVKAPDLASIQRNNGHRRGISLDQKRRQNIPIDRMVSNINPGFSTTSQHILQETQQQRLLRPGQTYAHFDEYEGYLNSPIVTPHRQSFDTEYSIPFGENIQPSSSIGPINSYMGIESCNFNESNELNVFPSDPALASSNFLEFCSSQRRSVNDTEHENYNGVSRFENLALQSPQRPITPSDDNFGGYLPPTPTDTPHVHMLRHGPMNARFMNDYDTSMEETIKPGRHQRARGIFDDMRKELERNVDPSPPLSDPITETNSFDSDSIPIGNFATLSAHNLEFLKNQNQFGHGTNFSHNHADMSPALSGHESPSKDFHISLFSDPFLDAVKYEAKSMPLADSSIHTLMSLSPRHKSTTAKAVAGPVINLEESITETGVTIDDIASYISGPDPLDGGKWLCKYPGCNKRFGRKENIKSHVQTHLGDRQFQCPYCKKCFVRQHDLKRHAKIHSGVKPYPCQCGNSFARHDALTRHRQRGMCIGAFEGVVKKVAKRGRPRKSRPSDDERLHKSSQTKKKNKKMSIDSSTSGCSESDVTSPGNCSLGNNDGFDFFQPSFMEQNTSFDYSQQHSSRPGPYLSSHSTEIQGPKNAGMFQVPENTHLPSFQPKPPLDSIQLTQSNHSSPQLCLSRPGSASNKFFAPDQVLENDSKLHVKISEISKIPAAHENDFFRPLVAVNRSSNIHGTARDHDFLIGKFVDPFSCSPGDEYYHGPTDVFFGNS